ncbi:putative ferric-chelate reductase 1 isoform X1 [Sander lucioperca]|uniref:putative ferric-chelate reductase 1 isoform X1 n=2 Tax=Sander lucioperca TaxID=283035 RepID=UPI0016538D71|nr:putative ferric-chelate reductase 1 isoform X1 [Sander lucioperca]
MASAMWRSYFLLAVLSAGTVEPVTAYSNGKVSVACEDMVPQHGYDPSLAPPPYSITVDTSTFSPSDNVTVSLQVASSNTTFFTGFLIEARDAGKLDSPAVGFFVLTDPAQSQLLQCGLNQGSGVSHTRSTRKTHVQAVWEPPNNPPQRVQFLVTVVYKYKVYWVKIAGPVVSLRGVTAVPSTADSGQTTSPTALSTPFSSAGCGHSKSCLRDPVGCHPESDPHCFFLSFASDQEGSGVMFELSGPAEGYLSFALSLDKWMGNDDVYLCVNDGGRVTISAAYVSGRTPPELITEEDLWGRAWRFADGVIQCRFQRNICVPQGESRFNLNQSYFLFLTHGISHQGVIHRHNQQPLISTNQKAITGYPEDLVGSRSPLLLKFHGVLMLTVWMWTVSTAIIIARHYKDCWPDTTLLGQKLWFQLHRTMAVLAVVLTAVAFTLPFIYRMGWSKHAGSHPYIGCTVMALSVIQLIVGFLRPAPESPRRRIFNWVHLVTGTAGQILAVGCVFLGVAQQTLPLPSPWSSAVLTGWLLWIVLANLLLQNHSYRLRSRGNGNGEDKESLLFAQLARQQHREVSKVKKMVLVVFVMGNTGFLAAFINAIANV